MGIKLTIPNILATSVNWPDLLLCTPGVRLSMAVDLETGCIEIRNWIISSSLDCLHFRGEYSQIKYKCEIKQPLDKGEINDQPSHQIIPQHTNTYN